VQCRRCTIIGRLEDACFPSKGPILRKKSALPPTVPFGFVNLGKRLQDSVSLLPHPDSVSFCLQRSQLAMLILGSFVHAAEVPQREAESAHFLGSKRCVLELDDDVMVEMAHMILLDLLLGKEAVCVLGLLIWPTGNDEVPFLASRKPLISVALQLMPRCTQLRNLDAKQ
jgi:hypothetical protein